NPYFEFPGPRHLTRLDVQKCRRRPENVLRSVASGRYWGLSGPSGSDEWACPEYGWASIAGRSAVGNSGVRRWPGSKRRGSSVRRGGRSLAISTAIHGNGTDAATISSEIRPLCQAP